MFIKFRRALSHKLVKIEVVIIYTKKSRLRTANIVLAADEDQ